MSQRATIANELSPQSMSQSQSGKIQPKMQLSRRQLSQVDGRWAPAAPSRLRLGSGERCTPPRTSTIAWPTPAAVPTGPPPASRRLPRGGPRAAPELGPTAAPPESLRGTCCTPGPGAWCWASACGGGVAWLSVIHRRSAASRRHTSAPIQPPNICRFAVAHSDTFVDSAAVTTDSRCSDCRRSTAEIEQAPISWCRRFGNGSLLGSMPAPMAAPVALGSYGAARMPAFLRAKRRSLLASSWPACCALRCRASRSFFREGSGSPGSDRPFHTQTGPSRATTSAVCSRAYA
eukprot:scaffold903_cov262-Pinguiococcus_pyrenoidosus.AAC.29